MTTPKIVYQAQSLSGRETVTSVVDADTPIEIGLYELGIAIIRGMPGCRANNRAVWRIGKEADSDTVYASLTELAAHGFFELGRWELAAAEYQAGPPSEFRAERIAAWLKIKQTEMEWADSPPDETEVRTRKWNEIKQAEMDWIDGTIGEKDRS